MRLYTMSKGSFALVISSFVVSFLLCIFIGLAGEFSDIKFAQVLPFV